MGIVLRILGLLGRHYPFNKGTNYLAHHTPLKWICNTAPLKVKLRSGVRLMVDPKDYNGRMVALFGLQEPNITTICKSYLQSSDVFLDIGANNGAVGLNCIDYADEVHQFEPQPHLCKNITDSINDHGLDNVSLHPIGLMDHDDELEMHVIDNHTGTGSFIRNHSGSTIKVPVKQASTYLTPLLKGRTFGAKVDVEGAEGAVLPELLKLPNMRFIIFECQGECDIWGLIKDTSLYGIESTWIKPKYTKINTQTDMKKFEDFIIKGQLMDT